MRGLTGEEYRLLRENEGPDDCFGPVFTPAEVRVLEVLRVRGLTHGYSCWQRGDHPHGHYRTTALGHEVMRICDAARAFDRQGK